MTQTCVILSEPAPHVQQIAINRPEAKNAIDEKTRLALIDAIESALANKQVRALLPLSEACNPTPDGFLNPYDMVADLSLLCQRGDHIVPCSSGGAFTVMMQAFQLKSDQTMIKVASNAIKYPSNESADLVRICRFDG